LEMAKDQTPWRPHRNDEAHAMRTVELLRTLLFLPSWIGSAWALHRFAEWGWLGSIGLGLVIAIAVALVATLLHDWLT
jgi:hypothetical protein